MWNPNPIFFLKRENNFHKSQDNFWHRNIILKIWIYTFLSPPPCSISKRYKIWLCHRYAKIILILYTYSKLALYNQSHANTGFKVPIEVDKALEHFVERLLNEYVYLWYREISYDEDFVQEIRQVLRHAIGILCKRLCR